MEIAAVKSCAKGKERQRIEGWQLPKHITPGQLLPVYMLSFLAFPWMHPCVEVIYLIVTYALLALDA